MMIDLTKGEWITILCALGAARMDTDKESMREEYLKLFDKINNKV